MILIIDCGSTKADWTFLESENIIERFTTNGFNPNFCDLNLLSSITLENIHQNIDIKNITNVYYYGTGCGNDININKVKSVFEAIFINAKIEVFSDILGSCRALFGNEPGIACILGTGSNACFYDGKNITKNVVSLGYMLGDEGSGCYIGKQIIHDYFYGIMPDDLHKKFNEEYNLTRDVLIEKVYKSAQPSRFLASFTKFASENIENQYIKNLISKCFDEFIELYIKPFESYENIGFVGSIAFYFQDILCKCIENQNLNIKEIVKSPMDGLIDYYSKQDIMI